MGKKSIGGIQADAVANTIVNMTMKPVHTAVIDEKNNKKNAKANLDVNVNGKGTVKIKGEPDMSDVDKAIAGRSNSGIPVKIIPDASEVNKLQKKPIKIPAIIEATTKSSLSDNTKKKMRNIISVTVALIFLLYTL